MNIDSLGIFFSCFREEKAVNFSIEKLREIYDAPIFLVSDGGLDFSYLEKKYENIQTQIEEDTMSDTFKVTDKNFREEVHQMSIKKCSLAVLDRLSRAIDFCQTDYMLMMDPDTYVRGRLNIPDGVQLLGSRINHGFPDELKKVLREIDGAVVIDTWGATPAIFETESFNKAYSFLKSHMEILDKFCQSFYAIYAHDVLLPLMFALIGYEETYNPDIIECKRFTGWQQSLNPLVHQFKENY